LTFLMGRGTDFFSIFAALPHAAARRGNQARPVRDSHKKGVPPLRHFALAIPRPPPPS